MTINPMLCQDTKEDLLGNFDDSWICQDKVDGIRAIVFVENGKVKICGRGNKGTTIITHRYPEFDSIFSSSDNFVIDSEIVTKDEIFNHTQIRDQNNNPFKVRLVSQKYPAKIMAFDLLELNGQDLSNLPFIQRFKQLRATVANSDWITVLPIFTDLQKRFDLMKSQEKEGIILKRINGSYVEGKRSPDWIKCKFWKETIISFNKYETNPSGITVENDDGTRVLVAGAGASKVKDLIDMSGSVDLEIQYLEKTKNGAYRMPTFKRINAQT